MGAFYEGRSSCCYICKFFVQNESVYRNGICVKHPPQKIDETLALAVSGPPAGFLMFPNVFDSITGFCGDFQQATLMPSDTANPPPVFKQEV